MALFRSLRNDLFNILKLKMKAIVFLLKIKFIVYKVVHLFFSAIDDLI